jgi:hypothetical protein
MQRYSKPPVKAASPLPFGYSLALCRLFRPSLTLCRCRRGDSRWRLLIIATARSDNLKPNDSALSPSECNANNPPGCGCLEAITHCQPFLALVQFCLTVVADLILTQKRIVLLLSELACSFAFVLEACTSSGASFRTSGMLAPLSAISMWRRK